MGRVHGVSVDNEARLQLLGEMNGKVSGFEQEAQAYVPPELFPIVHRIEQPTPQFLEKERAREVKAVDVPNPEVKTCSRCGAQHVTQAKHTSTKGGRGAVPLNACYKAPLVLLPGTDVEYDVVLPFNPGSDDQLRDYASAFKHRLGRNWRTGKDTLDEKQVQRFIDRYGDKHPIYQLALSIRKVRKARGYAKAWIPDELGKVYGHFKNVPETLRLSQADHNFMNVSHRGNVPYAEELRRLLVAPPGYLFVEADSASIEAVFSGKFMGSASYMAMARKGIHATWALAKLGMEPTAANIKWVKNAPEHQVLYETKKRTVHGVSYGMGAKLLHESYPEFFPAEWLVDPATGRKHLCETCSAQREIDEFYGFVPDLKQWHSDTQKWAHKHGYLESPWGFRNYYYRVFSFDWKDQKWKMGEDAKAAIAFQPQHANGMFQRENLLKIHQAIGKMGLTGKWWQPAIGHVHDSNGLMVPEDDVDRARDLLGEIMNRPIKQLDNIQVGVGIKAGHNWADMKSIGSVA
jgi:hypothetical protein